jgi:hypothetical protein
MTKTMRLLRWVGGVAGVPLVAAGYRAVAARRAALRERQLVVRTTVEPELVEDLVDLVRRVRGRATLAGRDTVSVPVPKGVAEDAAYVELRALLHSWELRHPGVRAEISWATNQGRTRRRTVARVAAR